MYEKVKYVTTCTGQCLSPSSKLSELWRKEETALFQQAWGQEIPDVGPSSSQEGELWIMKPFLALLLHNSNFACGDFTDKPFSLTWWQAPLSKFPLRFPSISSVLSISTSVRKCRAKELLLATCLDREKGISVIAPLGNPRKGYLYKQYNLPLFVCLPYKQNILPLVRAACFLLFNTSENYY